MTTQPLRLPTKTVSNTRIWWPEVSNTTCSGDVLFPRRYMAISKSFLQTLCATFIKQRRICIWRKASCLSVSHQSKHEQTMNAWTRQSCPKPQKHFNGLYLPVMMHTVTSELRQMRQKQDQEKRDLVESQRSMSSIEAAAQRQYQADLKAAEQSQKQRLGEWVSVHVEY